jgi:hypothetical protein
MWSGDNAKKRSIQKQVGDYREDLWGFLGGILCRRLEERQVLGLESLMRRVGKASIDGLTPG